MFRRRRKNQIAQTANCDWMTEKLTKYLGRLLLLDYSSILKFKSLISSNYYPLKSREESLTKLCRRGSQEVQQNLTS